MDVRSEESVAAAVSQAVAKFGRIDVCMNNASAIVLQPTSALDMKKFDLMNQVNVRGTFLASKLCVPHMRDAENPHVLTLSPPLDMNPQWFAPHTAYTMAKYGMSMVVLGMAAECKKDGIAFNALWPRAPIATAAIEFAVGNKEFFNRCRTPDIMADAAHAILTQPSRAFTGRFCIDDSVLFELGLVTDFERYRIDKSQKLAPDLFIRARENAPPGVADTIDEAPWQPG